MHIFDKMSYGVSSYGREYLVDEGLKELPPLRIALIIINILLLLGPTAYLSHQFWKIRNALKQLGGRRKVAPTARKLINWLTAAGTLNNTLRGLLVIDQVIRPASNLVPKWAHEKLWLTELEVLTLSNILVTVLYVIGVGRLQRLIAQWNRTGIRITVAILSLYIIGTLTLGALVQYTIEPPTNYEAVANLTIGGSAITTIPLIYVLVRVVLKLPKKAAEPLVSEKVLSATSIITGSSSARSARKRQPVERLSY